jgi:hypothetical protein
MMMKVGTLRRERSAHVRPGSYVQVRAAHEIEATLDDDGCLDGLPFMPEMARHCGSVHRVFKVVDKVIDIIQYTGLRRMSGAVTLEGLRCDGSAHANCQSGCHILWKLAWLRPASVSVGVATSVDVESNGRLAACLAPGTLGLKPDTYRCQATELYRATSYLHPWDPRQYLVPLSSGNVTFADFLRVVSIDAFNAVQRLRNAAEFPYWPGSRLEKTPTVDLGLQAGEWVRVRSKEEILQTLDGRNRNRGLWFDREMLRYCGRRFRVLKRVEQLIEEKSGRLVRIKTPGVILDGVTVSGELYRFNPQNEFLLWREVWLERDQETERLSTPAIALAQGTGGRT